MKSQKKDGHVGGKKYVVGSGTVPQIESCTNDHKFTLLPITSATGEAVCCVVIFQSLDKTVPLNWKTGIDITVTPIRGQNGEID